MELKKKFLTKRDELLFLMVLALPKASKTGLAWMIWPSREPWEKTFSPSISTSAIIHMYWTWARSIVLHRRTSITFAYLGIWSRLPSSGTHVGEVLDDLFGVLSLASSRFSTVYEQWVFFFSGIGNFFESFITLRAHNKIQYYLVKIYVSVKSLCNFRKDLRDKQRLVFLL